MHYDRRWMNAQAGMGFKAYVVVLHATAPNANTDHFEALSYAHTRAHTMRTHKIHPQQHG